MKIPEVCLLVAVIRPRRGTFEAEARHSSLCRGEGSLLHSAMDAVTCPDCREIIDWADYIVNKEMREKCSIS